MEPAPQLEDVVEVIIIIMVKTTSYEIWFVAVPTALKSDLMIAGRTVASRMYNAIKSKDTLVKDVFVRL